MFLTSKKMKAEAFILQMSPSTIQMSFMCAN